MSLFVRLSTVAVVAVLLRCVPATVDITAPSTVTATTAGVETYEQGSTAWICSALAVDSPWTSYANIRGYLEGGNSEKKDYSNLVLYPVMELFHATESRLCVYLPAEDHCYPPAPNTNQVKVVKQLTKQNYYAIRFWGQASDARVQSYKKKLMAALITQNKAANLDLFFVSYFSAHVREARFDAAPTAAGKSAVPPVESGAPTCPAASVYPVPGSTVKAAGQEYHLATIPASRLSFSDVRTKDMSSTNMDSCAAAASSEGRNAFSFAGNVCKLYNFGKDFCQCTPGEFEIYINKKLLGIAKDLGDNRVAGNDLMEMVIYLEVSWTAGPFQKILTWKSPEEGDLAVCQTMVRMGAASYLVAIVLGNYCYQTRVIDVTNCNQTCRGNQEPVQAIAMKPSPSITIGPPFLLLCGKNFSIPMAAGTTESTVNVFSHAGHGCHPYPAAKSVVDEDCLVIFKKPAAAKNIAFELKNLNLNSVEGVCQDFISVHQGKIPDKAKNEDRTCKGDTWMMLTDFLAINFHRKQGNKDVGSNIGFKLSFTSKA